MQSHPVSQVNRFGESTPIVSWQQDGFRIDLHHHSHRPPGDTHGGWVWLCYLLFDEVWADETGHDAMVFAGEDLGVATFHRPGEVRVIEAFTAVSALCSFLSCQPGDAEASYFDSYTPTQLAWRDARADDLALSAHDLGQAHAPTTTGHL